MADLILRNHGSIMLLTPTSEAGREWVRDNRPEDVQTFGRGVVVEPRFIDNVVAGAQGDGLEVQ